MQVACTFPSTQSKVDDCLRRCRFVRGTQLASRHVSSCVGPGEKSRAQTRHYLPGFVKRDEQFGWDGLICLDIGRP
jgi:hypothetical protein